MFEIIGWIFKAAFMVVKFVVTAAVAVVAMAIRGFAKGWNAKPLQTIQANERITKDINDLKAVGVKHYNSNVVKLQDARDRKVNAAKVRLDSALAAGETWIQIQMDN